MRSVHQDEKDELYKKLCDVGNDAQFKMYMLRKMDNIENNHAKLDKNFNMFKLRAYVFISLLVGAKETLMRKFLG